MIVHRLTGDAPRDLLIGPTWSLKKWEVLNGIDAELKRRDTWQGKLWGILMGFLSVLSFAHKLVSERSRPGDIALDATAGTGADTLYLAKCTGSKGKVYAFDIQEQAPQLTRDRLDKEPPGTLAEVTLHHQSHALMGDCVPECEHGRMGAVMFNLGYLPADSSDKRIMTETASTLTALEVAIEPLRPVITIGWAIRAAMPKRTPCRPGRRNCPSTKCKRYCIVVFSVPKRHISLHWNGRSRYDISSRRGPALTSIGYSKHDER